MNWLLRRNLVGWLAGLILLIGTMGASTSQAQLRTDVSAGPFWNYYSSDVGYSALASVMSNTAESGWSYGGELEYRKVSLLLGDAMSLDQVVDDEAGKTDVQSLILRAHGRYDFMRDSVIRPYVNLGLGVAFNWLDADTVVTSINNNGEQVYHVITNASPVGFDVLGGIGVQTEIPIRSKAIRVNLEMRTAMNVTPVSTVRTRDNKHTTDWAFLGGAGIYLGAGYQW